MWNSLVKIILKYRFVNLFIIAIITAFFAYNAKDVELSYEMAKMLPSNDSSYIRYTKFKEKFGEDGNVMFVGFMDSKFFELPVFKDYYLLNEDIKNSKGISEVVSLTKFYYLKKNSEKRKFDFLPLFSNTPKTQKELDSLVNQMFSLPLYSGLLYNKETKAHLMMITLDNKYLNNKNRIQLIENIKTKIHGFSKKHDLRAYYSGLPYIRTVTTKKVRNELYLFVILAMVVASLFLFIFYKSVKATFFPMVIVLILLIWTLGLIKLFGYKITILNGIIPPLLIIIIVENCIYLLNKYHQEYRDHGNKIRALSRVVMRVGKATFLTNATTAIGFGTFILTFNDILVEFGIISSISIMMSYVLTLFLIPIIFSYLPPPKHRHLRHLQTNRMGIYVSNVIHSVLYHKRLNFAVFFILIGIAIIGTTRLKTTGNVVDDIPKRDTLSLDLKFFEEQFKGIMPLEISIDTKKKNGIMQLSVLNKIDELQNKIMEYPELSKPLSIVEVVKSATQAYYNGKPSRYLIPNSQEKNFILSYIPNLNKKNTKKTILDAFVDTNRQVARISVHMKNIGTTEIKRIKEDLQPKIDSIFNPQDFKTSITGTSVVFLDGSNYLVKNLQISVLLAVLFIAIIMALLFSSIRMVIIIVITNLFPLLVTAGMMGYFNFSIKPSTIIVFSIAFGITVDNAIHFLAKYRQELKYRNWNIKESIIYSLRESSIAMMYSTIVLFFGFSIFIASSFGGTQALGLLISLTLLVAGFSNIIILPTLLLVLKRFTTKAFQKPVFENIDIYDENIEKHERIFSSRRTKFIKRLHRLNKRKSN